MGGGQEAFVELAVRGRDDVHVATPPRTELAVVVAGVEPRTPILHEAERLQDAGGDRVGQHQPVLVGRGRSRRACDAAADRLDARHDAAERFDDRGHLLAAAERCPLHGRAGDVGVGAEIEHGFSFLGMVRHVPKMH